MDLSYSHVKVFPVFGLGRRTCLSCDKTSALVVTVTVTVTVRLREDQRREQTNISGQAGRSRYMCRVCRGLEHLSR